MNDLFKYIGIILMLLFSAFFSASEIAFASVSATRLKSVLQERNTLSVRLANVIKEKYEDALSAILIGNTLVNNAASAIATVIVIKLLSEKFAWVSTLVMTLVILTFGEVVPKVLAKQFCEKFSITVSVPLYIFTLIFKPITVIAVAFVNLCSKLWSKNVADVDAVSADDLENIIDIIEDEGVLDSEQCDLLQNALDFDDICAYEIITPRVDMQAIDIRDPYETNIKKIFEFTYSRIPVYEDTPDNIIGVLMLNRVYKELIDDEKVNIRDLLLPAVFVHKTMPLPDVLEKMKSTKCHLVVVLDEYGGTMGIISMEDVLEQLVGEIWDETDDIENEFVCIDDTHFTALGDMRVEDFFDEFDIDIEDMEDFDNDTATLGGFVTMMLEGEAEENSVLTFKNLEITVLEADEKRVEKVAVRVIEERETDDDETDE